MDPERLIARHGLKPHPEGGWYREIHRSGLLVQRQNDGQMRNGLTVIVFLLQAGDTSRWHRVLGADEVWHHVDGDPLELLRLPPLGGSMESLRLGAYDNDEPAQSPLQVVPAGWWQAARSLGAWSLMHCLVGPGFAFEDFSLMAELDADQQPPGADSLWL